MSTVHQTMEGKVVFEEFCETMWVVNFHQVEVSEEERKKRASTLQNLSSSRLEHHAVMIFALLAFPHA